MPEVFDGKNSPYYLQKFAENLNRDVNPFLNAKLPG